MKKNTSRGRGLSKSKSKSKRASFALLKSTAADDDSDGVPETSNLNAPANTPTMKDAVTVTSAQAPDDEEGPFPKDDSLDGNKSHPKANRTSGEPPSNRPPGRIIIKNLWEICCKEIEEELSELDTVLQKFGLPSVKYSKLKSFEITDYSYPPPISSSKAKDFLDFYVFPYLLPAIQSLIQYFKTNRIFQCRTCAFNPLDYIVEYLYNNNPRYPDRLLAPLSVYDIPFCQSWLLQHPRKPPPRWMLMSTEEAAIIIQRTIRGFLVRCKPEVQEMRQFWRELRTENEEEDKYGMYNQEMFKDVLPSTPPSGADDQEEEIPGEMDDCFDCPARQDNPELGQGEGPPSPTGTSHHSLTCVYCNAFRRFLDGQPPEVLDSYRRPSPILASNGETLKPGDGVDNEEEDEEESGLEGEENITVKRKTEGSMKYTELKTATVRKGHKTKEPKETNERSKRKKSRT